jgi:hypothetical protein
MKIKSILRLSAAIGLSALVVGLFSFKGALATVPGVNEAVDINTSGGVPSNYAGNAPGDYSTMSMSQNGRYIAFSSSATNITSDYSDSKQQIFLRDRLTNTTTLISKNTTTGEAGARTSQQPNISASGRYIVYVSAAWNLTSATIGSGSYNHIYRYDRVANITEVVDTDSTGSITANNRMASNPTVSADGNYVVFEYKSLDSSNLVSSPSLSANRTYAFRKNMSTGAVTLVSVGTSNTNPNSDSTRPLISCGGDKIMFTSAASNLVAGGNSGNATDVYIYDALANSTKNITPSANGASNANSLSCSGQFAGITSAASNLSSASTSNGKINTFSYSTVNNDFTLLSQSSSSSQSSRDTLNPVVSDDGKHAVFECFADCGLVSGSPTDTNIYLRNTESGTTEVVSASSTGTPANRASQNPTLSADGRYVAYASKASDLVSGYYFLSGSSYQWLYYVSQTGATVDY